MAKEEILRKHLGQTLEEFQDLGKKNTLDAMEEYAIEYHKLMTKELVLPHDSEVDNVLDKLLIMRGEHPTRVRNSLYGEERQLAKDLVKFVLLS